MGLRRVAVVAYHSSPLEEPGSGDAGGMTVYVRALSEALARRRVWTDVFTRATSETPLVTDVFPGVRVISIEAGPRTHIDKELVGSHLAEFVAATRAFSTAHRARYDVLHSHYWQSGLAAQELRRLWGVPWVHSHHTLGRVKNARLAPGDSAEPESRLSGEASVVSSADMLIASTEEDWHQLSCLYGAPHDRIRLIYPGVDHTSFRPGNRMASREALGIRKKDAVILYAGRIQPLKGIDLALRAVEELVPALDRPVAFLVVGGASGRVGDEELARLRDLSLELGLRDNVRFLGPKPHSSLPDYYRAADVAVVCSHSESFGLAALEAHACGTPVVATRVGGVAHVVRDGETGFVIGTRDPSEIAARLKTLLADDELRSRMGEAAAARANAFSWDRTAREFLDLYECLITADFPEACTC